MGSAGQRTTEELTFRRGGPADAPLLAAVVEEGFEGYRAFAPPGWEPLAEASDFELMRTRLGDDDVWCLIAEEPGAGIAGHVSFGSTLRSRGAGGEEGLAHLWQLFVRRPWWGSGLARTLLHRAHAAAAERGYAEMRLFTPAGQARARRFYEREGWTTTGEPIEQTMAGLPLVEYRRRLP